MAVNDESGQSLIEVLFLMPLVVVVVVLLYRSNAAIQMSIVNQKQLRGQALYVAMNSPTYPDLQMRRSGESSMERVGYSAFVMGVTDDPTSDARGQLNAVAQVQAFGRPGRRIRGDTDCSEADPTSRSKICLKTAIEFCTQINAIPGTSGVTRYPDGLGENMQSAMGSAFCRSAYGD